MFVCNLFSVNGKSWENNSENIYFPFLENSEIHFKNLPFHNFDRIMPLSDQFLISQSMKDFIT